MTTEDKIKQIREVIAEKNYTAYYLGKHCNISVLGISKFIKGISKPNQNTVNEIYQFLFRNGHLRFSDESRFFTGKEIDLLTKLVAFQIDVALEMNGAVPPAFQEIYDKLQLLKAE